MSETSANNKRIAKNTLVLYVRMLFLMAISLYTSRVILQALGVEDFGIYNVVGGSVALFAVLSRSLSGAASRFLNFEMGRSDWVRLARVFSSSLTIHIVLALLIAAFAELFGVWFVNSKMVIPPERLYAANWVFQFSVLSFCYNLVTVPYHASIIAHERMSVFAYISIFEGVGKLLICYMIIASPFDRLILYSFLLFLIQFIVQLLNQWYCKRHFAECKYHPSFDKPLLREIFSYASWNMIGTSSAILRNQGGNILINLFYGPTVNAARAVANQVLHAVQGFVDNFFMALRPQITKSYACGDWEYMMELIFQGSRLSFYMLLFLCLPIIIGTDFILSMWLGIVPNHSVAFVQLTLLFTMIESISGPLITAQLATGKIRNYQLVVGGLQMLNLPISYVVLEMGTVPETILYVAIVISFCCLIFRLYMLNRSINLKVGQFVRSVLLNIGMVSITSAVIPVVVKRSCVNSISVFSLVSLLCIICTSLSIIFVGCSRNERRFIWIKANKVYNQLKSKN